MRKLRRRASWSLRAQISYADFFWLRLCCYRLKLVPPHAAIRWYEEVLERGERLEADWLSGKPK